MKSPKIQRWIDLLATVTGGTGRFTGASGSLSRTGSVSTVTVAGEFEMSGTLVY